LSTKIINDTKELMIQKKFLSLEEIVNLLIQSTRDNSLIIPLYSHLTKLM